MEMAGKPKHFFIDQFPFWPCTKFPVWQFQDMCGQVFFSPKDPCFIFQFPNLHNRLLQCSTYSWAVAQQGPKWLKHILLAFSEFNILSFWGHSSKASAQKSSVFSYPNHLSLAKFGKLDWKWNTPTLAPLFQFFKSKQDRKCVSTWISSTLVC